MADKETRLLGYRLALFLFLVALVVVAALYWDLRQKNRQLSEKVAQLESSQVLLMVPDEQAAIIADWMSRHPQQTASLLDVIRPKVTSGTEPEAQTSTKLSVSPGDISPERTQGEAGATVPLPAQTEDARVTELENGVKVIRLPHGGIRVTTREEGNE
ncbi:membrane anchored protein in chemotaxis locus [Shewanella algae]|uniref:membrane anchored protein in chemotaxis locus n=1 Tax=Shewanella algae TaxID=38313 RepID=UPI000BB5F20B|nr:membrane anchored protein in chemotaxis locus [Shewanella algae]MBO2602886.1 membrane anchored protein in chemotaxis locus [Shewanella algae]MBO2628072.1 membrane anchored protein in chemotaxis locus [Shewanella algae]MBO2653258.1 membrane anchored protein in chemotaxis locus [Shewanella algae]MBO2691496.1 membrane anchored protein in chemotaxis locus [Shewanella algae]MCE9774231.1 membrane anchored protein in chemotaxis locus [Shewanella algae]